MKTLAALTFLTLMCFLHHNSAEAKSLSGPVPEECCLQVTDKGIPRRMVRGVTKTPNDCKGHPALIITTVQRKICMDPNCDWAKVNRVLLNQFLKKK